MSEVNKIDYDSIYNEEYNTSFTKYFQEVKDLIASHSNRLNHYITQKIHDYLDEIKVSLRGHRKDSSTFTDRYFNTLLSDFDHETGHYKTQPISNYIKNEYKRIREWFVNDKTLDKPEIYALNEIETVKYIARYKALNTLFNKIVNITWKDEENEELFLRRILDKDYFEPGIDYSVLIKFFNQGDDFGFAAQKIESTKISLTAHAIAYYLLYEAEPKKYPIGIKDFTKYCEKTGLDNPKSLKTKVNDGANLLKTALLDNLNNAKAIIESNNCETALKEIKKFIAKRNKDKD
jgi:hypothetical protein